MLGGRFFEIIRTLFGLISAFFPQFVALLKLSGRQDVDIAVYMHTYFTIISQFGCCSGLFR